MIEMKSFAVEEYGNMRMNEGMKKGKDEGIKEGIKEGRKEGRKDVASILKDKGYSKSDILESCKISEKEYLNL